MQIPRMNLTNQFIEQMEKVEDNYKLLKVFYKLPDFEYKKEILNKIMLD